MKNGGKINCKFNLNFKLTRFHTGRFLVRMDFSSGLCKVRVSNTIQLRLAMLSTYNECEHQHQPTCSITPGVEHPQRMSSQMKTLAIRFGSSTNVQVIPPRAAWRSSYCVAVHKHQLHAVDERKCIFFHQNEHPSHTCLTGCRLVTVTMLHYQMASRVDIGLT